MKPNPKCPLHSVPLPRIAEAGGFIWFGHSGCSIRIGRPIPSGDAGNAASPGFAGVLEAAGGAATQTSSLQEEPHSPGPPHETAKQDQQTNDLP